jgi:PhzF family phenazine biosynthesis protein
MLEHVQRSTRLRRFAQVDVFGTAACAGNPVAVVLDAEGLDDATFARFARWTNLSETTFVLPADDPAADYRVRIFTPDEELPFAGHPTLGTCHAWLTSGGVPAAADVIVQQCGVGLVRIRRTPAPSGHTLSFAAPPLIRSGSVDPADLSSVLSGLGLHPDDVVEAAWADNGPGWLAIRLADAAKVLSVVPGSLEGFYVGLVGPHAPDDAERFGAAFEVRAFFPHQGSTAEDPVTGSLNASIALWLIGEGVMHPPLRIRQGTALRRSGIVEIDRDESGTVWVGGATQSLVTGTVDI